MYHDSLSFGDFFCIACSKVVMLQRNWRRFQSQLGGLRREEEKQLRQSKAVKVLRGLLRGDLHTPMIPSI